MIDTAAEIRTILNFYEDKGGYTSNSKVGDYYFFTLKMLDILTIISHKL